MAKPTRLRFVGAMLDKTDQAGNVIGQSAERWYEGVPARDLEETDLAEFDDATVKMLTGQQADGSDPLYVDDSPKASKPAAEKGKD